MVVQCEMAAQMFGRALVVGVVWMAERVLVEEVVQVVGYSNLKVAQQEEQDVVKMKGDNNLGRLDF